MNSTVTLVTSNGGTWHRRKNDPFEVCIGDSQVYIEWQESQPAVTISFISSSHTTFIDNYNRSVDERYATKYDLTSMTQKFNASIEELHRAPYNGMSTIEAETFHQVLGQTIHNYVEKFKEPVAFTSVDEWTTVECYGDVTAGPFQLADGVSCMFIVKSNASQMTTTNGTIQVTIGTKTYNNSQRFSPR